MNNWEYLFEDRILYRGYTYTDLVEITHRDDEKVTAKVSGTIDYRTEITFSNGQVDDMYCSCPYFDTDNCKHLAALLYVLEEIETEEIKDYSDDDFEELFNSVDDDELKKFLFERLRADPELLNKFKLKFSNKVNPAHYKSKLSDICFEDQNRYSINNFLTEDMHFLLDKGEYELVLELLDDVFPFIKDWWYYWEDYGSDGNMEEFTDITERLIDTDVHDELFEWLGDLIYAVIDDYHMDDLIELYFREFSGENELKAKEKLLDRLFDKTRNIRWIIIKIDLMPDLGYCDEEIDKFRQDYTYSEKIMQQYINSQSGQKKEELLKEAISKFDYNQGYKVQLKEYYNDLGDNENYLTVLEDLVFEYPFIEYFEELRQNYNGDWSEKRLEIFEEHKNVRRFLNECYAIEGMYDLLIDNVDNLWELDSYREILIKDYPDEVIEKYTLIATNMANRSGTPKHYRQITDILKIIRKIPGGEDRAVNLAEEFRVKYKRRPRMMEALENGGF